MMKIKKQKKSVKKLYDGAERLRMMPMRKKILLRNYDNISMRRYGGMLRQCVSWAICIEREKEHLWTRKKLCGGI